ncbi:TPA: hypothetical protein I7221_10680 [Vibrio vulnificus]|uniref:Uncharacterized protein n=1 Tax=Vibrio vulnificus TaxID=672 RepID=A0AAN1PSK5_VIBVL|nr:hypothetical protein [Vibrio vulnificus]ANN28933.1 hypothetical protein FORC17_3870 [Vibrio vulnificus]AXX62193.1 hypothetical protein FORC53_3854 [Vibrio vulnificus]EIO3975934.1 hypothetical protein [Vibrio vulnificus]EIO3996255.1 hypothetical protein [Vibrio vulnificus]MCA0758818.1 hypothetical protein [Vibrio vulnificus]
MSCNKCETVKEVGGFNSFPDYASHKQAVIQNDSFKSVPVLVRYGSIGGVDEDWFECMACGSVWRLVEPDPPFKGMWTKVSG